MARLALCPIGEVFASPLGIVGLEPAVTRGPGPTGTAITYSGGAEVFVPQLAPGEVLEAFNRWLSTRGPGIRVDRAKEPAEKTEAGS